MDQLTPNIVQDRHQELAWWKDEPTHHMRFEANIVGLVDRWEIQGSCGTEHHT
jgi:hypothetical protein